MQQVNYWKADDRFKSEKTLDVIVNDEADSMKMCASYETVRIRRDVNDQQITVYIADLWPYTDIQAQVSVLNGFGNGVPSEIIKFKTLESGW